METDPARREMHFTKKKEQVDRRNSCRTEVTIDRVCGAACKRIYCRMR